MQLTRAADYAVRLVIHLATLPPGARTSRVELAEAGEIPEHFVGKILQTLNRAGLIASHRGVGGGYALAAAPEKVSILDIVEAVEGPTQLNVCVQPGMSCTRKAWCPAHTVWVEAQEAMTRVLRNATVAKLVKPEHNIGGVIWS
jgi:Rrf2 family protein